jgi:hypothetical protein
MTQSQRSHRSQPKTSISPSTELKYTVKTTEGEVQFDLQIVELPPMLRMASLKDEGGLLSDGAAPGVSEDIVRVESR